MSRSRRVATGGAALAVAGTVALTGSAPAGAVPRYGPAYGDVAVSSERQAIAALRRAAAAPGRTPYTGVQFVSTWSPGGTESFLIDVEHMPGAGTAVRSRGTSSRPAASVFMTESRSTGRGSTAGSTGAGSRDSRAGSSDSSGAQLSGLSDLALLARNYDLGVVGADRVAGRAATMVGVRRPGGVPAAAFWLDDETGLLLRREVYAPDGDTIFASAFVDLRPGRPVVLRHLPPRLPDPWASHSSSPSTLRERGWACPDSIGERLVLREVRRHESETGEVVHTSYSDGLAVVSVFEQQGRLDDTGLDGFRRAEVGDTQVWVDAGLPRRLVWSAGGSVFTVIADAPAEVVDEVVAALPGPQAPPDDGMMARMGRGLRRVASWVDPFS